jgi:hypothetical protein
MIEFNEAKHEYKVKGVKLPSVTQIIKWSETLPTNFYTEEGRDRGTEIHRLTEIYDLTGEILESKHKPYIEQYAKFINDTGCKIISCEEMIYSNLGYCGKLDRIIELNGELLILDIKTGAKANWHRLQLGAYSIPKMIQKGAILRLQPDRYNLDVIQGISMHLAQQEFKELVKRYRRENLC